MAFTREHYFASHGWLSHFTLSEKPPANGMSYIGLMDDVVPPDNPSIAVNAELAICDAISDKNEHHKWLKVISVLISNIIIMHKHFLYVEIAWQEWLLPTEAVQFVYWRHNGETSAESFKNLWDDPLEATLCYTNIMFIVRRVTLAYSKMSMSTLIRF